ncbi:hypothetical protein TcasGA2_TC000866 [Tribolium castaneum]|uniref:Uncharacterized protein n=1 Tax=Tribolium castaneum TaxID=7070 RepID=D6W8U9_TRICA|nr:hypothetical protein TcasGA2_TC000866 [Tribolium castaneum]
MSLSAYNYPSPRETDTTSVASAAWEQQNEPRQGTYCRRLRANGRGVITKREYLREVGQKANQYNTSESVISEDKAHRTRSVYLSFNQKNPWTVGLFMAAFTSSVDVKQGIKGLSPSLNVEKLVDH